MKTSAKRSDLSRILDRFSGTEILVVGDLILDQFVWGRVERISPEAPVPVVEVIRETVHLGGAANVASNLRVLGAHPLLIGLTGDDEAGRRLFAELTKQKIGTDLISAEPERVTSVKTRIIAHHQQVCRTDREQRLPPTPDTVAKLRDTFGQALPSARAVILSDYSKGVLAADLIGDLIDRAREAKTFVAVDPKGVDFGVYRRASVITPNTREAEKAAGVSIVDTNSLRKAGRILLERSSADYLLVTRGEEGMALFDHDSEAEIPTTAREVFDVTGAGDTVIATLALASACGASIYESAVIANHAAGIVVGKLGTAAATLEELYVSLGL